MALAVWWKLSTEGLVVDFKTLDVADWISNSSIMMDPQTGLFPWYLLSCQYQRFGSVECRIEKFWSKRKDKKDV